MASMLSRLTGTAGKADTDARSGLEPASVPEPSSVPLRQFGNASRASLLESLERSDLGWFWASDSAGRLVYISDPAAKRMGEAVDVITGQALTSVFRQIESDGETGGERPLKFQLAARGSLKPTIVQIGDDESPQWWEIAGVPQKDAEGGFAGYHGIARDVSDTYMHSRDAEKMSRYDSLTGLSNRHRMSRQLDATLTAFKVSKRCCALMLIDLDRFKQVNDTMGHPAGDELLKQVAARLKRVLGDKVEIGRIGGDEFQVIMPDEDDRGVLGDIGMRVIQMVSQPYSINGMRAVIGCSVGIAVAPFDGIDSDELVKAADLALYSAKGGGRGQFRFYSSDLRDKASHRHQIEADLRDAITREELEMHYQPIVDAKTHKVAAVEALMRWNHSKRGMISPADFIPVAEEVGIIRELGAWALRDVCDTIKTWPGNIQASVNVSAVQFASDDFVQVVKQALKGSGVNPAQIVLEITESVFVGDTERALGMFRELKALGVKLALDDFGTGYSSLSYLRDSPFDKIKIDQSFVRGCSAPDNRNDAIISAVVSLASAMGMETVAEGVETKDELEAVCALGASHIQGMLFARALTKDVLLERLEAGDLTFVPKGPEKYRAERRTEFRKIGLIHENDRYNVFLRNLSKTGAKIEGLLDVPVGTDIVLDLGGGQLAVATVRRSEGFSQGVEFETPLISDGADGLCTRHRVSPYQIEAAGRPLRSLNDEAVAAITGAYRSNTKAFVEVDMSKVPGS